MVRFFSLIVLLFAVSAQAEEAPACNDTGKIYKVCGDQQSDYDAKLAAAKEQKKLLVVVVGAEWCPWCVAMHGMLKDPKFGKGFAKKFVLSDVGVYNGKAKVPSGEAILAKLQEQAHDTKKIDGIPVLAVVNPANGKAQLINTEPLEKNTKTTKGHDPKKVLAALEAAQRNLQ